MPPQINPAAFSTNPSNAKKVLAIILLVIVGILFIWSLLSLFQLQTNPLFMFYLVGGGIGFQAFKKQEYSKAIKILGGVIVLTLLVIVLLMVLPNLFASANL